MDPSQFKILNYQPPVWTDVSDSLYKLTQDYIVTWEYLQDTYRLVIAAGDETDGASTPPWTAMIGITPVGRNFGPAVIHDKLYSCQGALPAGVLQAHDAGAWVNIPEVFTRAQCDAFFKTLLQAAGVDAWKCLAMYLAVRTFGWAFWSRALKTAAN